MQVYATSFRSHRWFDNNFVSMNEDRFYAGHKDLYNILDHSRIENHLSSISSFKVQWVSTFCEVPWVSGISWYAGMVTRGKEMQFIWRLIWSHSETRMRNASSSLFDSRSHRWLDAIDIETRSTSLLENIARLHKKGAKITICQNRQCLKNMISWW